MCQYMNLGDTNIQSMAAGEFIFNYFPNNWEVAVNKAKTVMLSGGYDISVPGKRQTMFKH